MLTNIFTQIRDSLEVLYLNVGITKYFFVVKHQPFWKSEELHKEMFKEM